MIELEQKKNTAVKTGLPTCRSSLIAAFERVEEEAGPPL